MATFGRIVADTLWGSLFLAHLSFPSVGSGFRSRMGALQALVQQEMRHESHRLFRCMSRCNSGGPVSAPAIIAGVGAESMRA